MNERIFPKIPVLGKYLTIADFNCFLDNPNRNTNYLYSYHIGKIDIERTYNFELTLLADHVYYISQKEFNFPKVGQGTKIYLMQYKTGNKLTVPSFGKFEEFNYLIGYTNLYKKHIYNVRNSYNKIS